MAETPKIFKGLIRFSGASPMEVLESESTETPSHDLEQREEFRPVLDTVKAYVKAAEELLGGKYKHLASMVPEYLVNPGSFFVACCPDGVVIRYEKRSGIRRSFFAFMPEGIAQSALQLSQHLVRCISREATIPPEEPLGVELRMAAVNPVDNSTREVFATRIWFDVVIAQPDSPPSPSQKPYCLLSVRNTLDIEMHGEMVASNGVSQSNQPFLARSTLRLGVGWECIEVYPNTQPSHWRPDYARVWAENEILACALVHHQREHHYNSLDPRAAARKVYSKLLSDFKMLLDSDPDREQTLQTFLQQNPSLLCTSYAQMWPKLSLGARDTDFVFRDALNDYLLVELERSTLPLFRKDGHATAALTHAQGQITDWKRYLEDNLATVQRELGLSGISTNPRALIVIGRSKSLTEHTRRKLLTMMNESPRLSVLTYDDVYENAKAAVENLLGPIWDVGGNTNIYFPSQSQS